jgi:hypothetical protein
MAQTKLESKPPLNKHPKGLSLKLHLFLTHLYNILTTYYSYSLLNLIFS